MIFGPELVRLVVRGKKTQTRRLIGVPRPARRRNGTTYMTTPWRPAVGKEEPVQPGRGKLAVCRVQVTDVRRELLAEISPDDAVAEGFDGVASFKRYWVRIHDKPWVAKRETVDGDQLPKEELQDRFDDRWADTLLWVVSFRLVGETVVRLAHAAAPAIRYRTVNGRHVIDESDRELVDLGYTTSERDALPDEPEVISRPLDPMWQVRSETMQQSAAAAIDTTRLSGLAHPDEQLRELRRMALERGIDISDDERVIAQRQAAIQRRLDEIERKVRGGVRSSAA